MSHLQSNTEKWLDSLVKDSEVIDAYKPYSCRLKTKQTVSDNFNFYYQEDDTDVKKNQQFYLEMFRIPDTTKETKTIRQLKDNVEYYDNREMLLKPNTNRFHANYLFKRLVDYCLENNLNYPTGPMFNVGLKNDFYKFCYENT